MTSAGLGLSMDISFLTVREPSLGKPLLDLFLMMTTLAMFVIGIVVLT